MIVYNYENLEDFLKALSKRINNEVFSQYIESKSTPDITSGDFKLILQFLGKPDINNTTLIALYQCVIRIKTIKERNDTIEELKKAFEAAGAISLIQGWIKEIFQSIS
ncbi:hypothetical protein DSAG12_00993 [Promethearchaeum syntrophicum]|uniref:Uncharacterized protein n=1 Tax=Promethearchaeum syntrophicum TaxID=2594042 RepID=A0A5B9D7K9_9ARCH|nr:hypothetical protein [Candidatus Prometheoarchaeum syntrophicum]QEE15169.1 hypothetical protein DSAG12_00993 [Candidatus Prometheoarchaeum syntrophicum]